MQKVALSLTLALVINALVAVGAAVAALDVAPAPGGPTDLMVSSSALNGADLSAVGNTLSGEASMSAMASRREPLNLAGVRTTVIVQGVQPNFAEVAPWQMDQGRFFTSQEDAALNPVAVVSQTIAKTATVGEIIRIRDIPFTIVGVGRNAQAQNVVLVPFRTAQIRLFGANAVDGIFIHIHLELGSVNQTQTVRGQVEGLLRARHNLRPGQIDDFSIAAVQPESANAPIISGSSVLRVIAQFVCSAKNSCARMGVN